MLACGNAKGTLAHVVVKGGSSIRTAAVVYDVEFGRGISGHRNSLINSGRRTEDTYLTIVIIRSRQYIYYTAFTASQWALFLTSSR